MAFDFDGKKYKEASKHQKEWGNKIIREMNIKEDSFILDLRCGDGVLTEVTVFKNINIYEENADRYFQNEEEIISWIDQPSIVPFISILPENMKQEFRNKVVKEMLERTKQKDGSYFETFRRINILAEKA